ncbi:MAG UNVERIFIED_CONTAM: hypothetical protein LVR18_34555, partial [Planctomycetaceae bacterium]|jgi:hypothetical protein
MYCWQPGGLGGEEPRADDRDVTHNLLVSRTDGPLRRMWGGWKEPAYALPEHGAGYFETTWASGLQ